MLKVREAIRKLNYKPNLLAKGLRLKSGHLIGLVVPELDPIHTFADIIRYAEESTSLHGYSLIVGNNRNSPDVEEQFIEDLIRRNVDGIIFSRVSDESRVLKLLDQRNIPIVVIDRVLKDESVPCVVIDNYRAGTLAAKHLVSLGHKHIACITGPLNITLCRERLDGFKQVLIDQYFGQFYAAIVP
jgi:DNA-binding LacI/PurR family transcriptional regulator